MVKNSPKPTDIDSWLEQLGLPSADRDYRPGHERVLALIQSAALAGLDVHEPKLRIRVAGTNGKGSTANYIAIALEAAGFRVGLYTSPHLLCFQERVAINQQPIEKDELLKLMEKIMPLALAVQASYFETATVLAWLYFSQQHVDVEVLEAGVGARLDATTALPAQVGMLTSVGIDHQAWLGETLGEITKEKLWVFSGCDICVSAPQQDDVEKYLQAMFPALHISASFDGSLAMLGQYQRINAGLAWDALLAIEKTKLPGLDLSQCKQAISMHQVRGRMQRIAWHGHQFWLDAAHNLHAIDALLCALNEEKLVFDIVFICSREDRDLRDAVNLLQPYTTKLVVMTGPKPYQFAHVSEALTRKVGEYSQGRFLVLGSFITLATTLSWMDDKS